MFDVDKLKEAADILNSATGIKLLLTRKHDVVREVITAVRMVVAGQPLWWCEPHSSKWYGGVCETAFIEGHHNRDCRKVEGWWMPTGKDET